MYDFLPAFYFYFYFYFLPVVKDSLHHCRDMWCCIEYRDLVICVMSHSPSEFTHCLYIAEICPSLAADNLIVWYGSIFFHFYTTVSQLFPLPRNFTPWHLCLWRGLSRGADKRAGATLIRINLCLFSPSQHSFLICCQHYSTITIFHFKKY